MLSYFIHGQGAQRVIIVHDWFSDTSSYDNARLFMDTDNFTYAFVDLRGYGGSKDIAGQFTVEEVADDLLEVANNLKWATFHFVGHSMTGMIAQYLAATAPKRLHSVAAITPVPACGSPLPDEVMAVLTAAAQEDDTKAADVVHMMTGGRYTPGFVKYKIAQWRVTTTPAARVGYLNMFVKTNFADKVQGNPVPMLVMAGQYDHEGHQAAEKTIMQWFINATLVTIDNSGHYPMQETPACFVSILESFLRQ